jgi:hypothetical protein
VRGHCPRRHHAETNRRTGPICDPFGHWLVHRCPGWEATPPLAGIGRRRWTGCDTPPPTLDRPVTSLGLRCANRARPIAIFFQKAESDLDQKHNSPNKRSAVARLATLPSRPRAVEPGVAITAAKSSPPKPVRPSLLVHLINIPTRASKRAPARGIGRALLRPPRRLATIDHPQRLWVRGERSRPRDLAMATPSDTRSASRHGTDCQIAQQIRANIVCDLAGYVLRRGSLR